MRVQERSEANSPGADDKLDLAAIGRATMPEEVDESPEVSEMLGQMPWWASRGLLYVVLGFVAFGLLWASLSPMDVVVEARGMIIPEGNVRPLQALEAGTVRTLLVKEGQSVRQGQTLVKLDDEALKVRERHFQTELQGAEISLIALRNANSDVSQILSAEARISQLRSDLDSVKLAIERSSMAAPVSGTVTALTVRGPGSVVEQGQAVAMIAPGDARMVAEVRIPNDQVGLIKPGLVTKLLIDAYPHQRYGPFDGTVLAISPDSAVTPGGESYYRAIVTPKGTTIKKGNRDLVLKPGLSLTAQIVTEKRSVLSLFLDPFRDARRKVDSDTAVAALDSTQGGRI